MAEPEPDAGDVDEAKEAFGGFVVAGCKAAAIFQLVEAALDHVAQGVDGHVDSLAHPSVPSHRYHGQGVAALDVFPNFIRVIAPVGDQNCWLRQVVGDRKSTRLNSSHVKISYAVFCLKQKIII